MAQHDAIAIAIATRHGTAWHGTARRDHLNLDIHNSLLQLREVIQGLDEQRARQTLMFSATWPKEVINRAVCLIVALVRVSHRTIKLFAFGGSD